MAITINQTSTITSKGQTTVPKAVRQALGVDYGGRIVFRIEGSNVTLVKAQDAEDPAIGSFLEFLAKDITEHPESIKGFPAELLARISALTHGVNADLDEAILGEVAL